MLLLLLPLVIKKSGETPKLTQVITLSNYFEYMYLIDSFSDL